MWTWVWSSLTSGWRLWITATLMPATPSFYDPVCTRVFLGFFGCCFSKDGVLESEWGLFTPPLFPTAPLSWDGVFLGGFFSVQVPSLIVLSLVSLSRCAPESLLVCSPIVEIPAANLSSSEEATSTWGSCCDKSAVSATLPHSNSLPQQADYHPCYWLSSHDAETDPPHSLSSATKFGLISVSMCTQRITGTLR